MSYPDLGRTEIHQSNMAINDMASFESFLALPPKKRKRITDCDEEEEPATVPAMSVSCDLLGAGPALFKPWKATPTMNEDEKLARALQAQENGGISSGRSLKRSDRRAAKKQRCESTKVC